MKLLFDCCNAMRSAAFKAGLCLSMICSRCVLILFVMSAMCTGPLFYRPDTASVFVLSDIGVDQKIFVVQVTQ